MSAHASGIWRALGGAIWVALALGGAVYSTRAAWAAWLYAEAKYDEPKRDCEQVVALCGRAYPFYPHNYFFSIIAAEGAYYHAQELPEAQRAGLLRAARLWCARGVAQNPWDSQLCRLKSRFLWEDSPARAIEYWKARTEWQFWEPYNHAVLADMYARVGRFDEASESLYWAQGADDYAAVRGRVLREEELRAVAATKAELMEDWGE